jgi:hypothetical protein
MTRIGMFFAALAAVVPAPAAPVPDGAKEPALYFPTRVGATATYQSPAGEFVHVVTHVETTAKGRVVTIAKGSTAAAVAPHAKVEVSGRGLFQVHSYGGIVGGDGQPPDSGWVAYTTPLCLLKLPATPGQKWDALDGPQGREVSVAGREERVRVPAGEFMAMPVETVPGKGRGQKTWYAPDVGPVKWTTPKGEVVLKAFAPGKQ